MLRKMIYCLFFPFLLIFPSPVNSDIVNQVYKFSKDFSTLATPALDWLAHMEFIAANASKFLKMGFPASALVAAGLDAAFPTKSPELVAINQLHEAMNNGFSNVDKQLQSIEGKILHRFNMAAYRTGVTGKIQYLLSVCQKVTDSIFARRHNYTTEFIIGCRRADGPENIMKNIRQLTRESCPIPTRYREELYIQARNVMWSIERYFGYQLDKFVDGFLEFAKVKTDFLIRNLMVDNDTAIDDLNKLENGVQHLLLLNRTVELYDFTHIIRNIVGGEENHNDECIFLTALSASHDETAALRLIGSMISADVTKLLDITAICSNASNYGIKESMVAYVNEIHDIATGILKFSNHWIEKKLELQWPTTQMKYAVEAIKKQEETVIPAGKYLATAERIANELIKRGLPRYHYHVLVSENWIGNEWYYGPVCFDDNCNGTTDIKGINVAVFRQPIASLDIARSAEVWIERWSKEIYDVISTETNITSLNMLAQIIDGKIGGILHENAFHGYLLLRNMKWKPAACVINVGLFTQPALTERAHALVEYFVNPKLSDAQRFNLFLFL